MSVVHPIKPVFDKNSKILILGSFPSVKSRESMFFYGHPQNRFWRVMARICNCELPDTVEEKKDMLLSNGIAVWDVIHSCEIVGSSDSSIKDVKVNDLGIILDCAKITAILVNGKKAQALYKKYLEERTGITAVCLPSTSPANAAWSEDSLFEYWKKEIDKRR